MIRIVKGVVKIDGVVYAHGAVIDTDATKEKRLIRLGVAERIESALAQETSAGPVAPVEKQSEQAEAAEPAETGIATEADDSETIAAAVVGSGKNSKKKGQ